MTDTLLVSDLHLDAGRPHISKLFIEFLRAEAIRAASLYILGDLFEIWIGDDDPDPHKTMIINALRECCDKGLPIQVMRGNRDFLLGPEFAGRSGCRLIDDPAVVEIHGQRTLLMHGDTLCTDDVEYQRFREEVRSAAWQRRFLSRSVEDRYKVAGDYRRASHASLEAKQPEIMDVNEVAVKAAMSTHGVRNLIHGHTHRPAIHQLTMDGGPGRRIVLGDWYERGSLLRIGSGECRLAEMTLGRDGGKLTIDPPNNAIPWEKNRPPVGHRG